MTKQELIDHLQHLEKYTHYSEDAPALRETIAMLKCSEMPNDWKKRTEERTETHTCDCISREAAIELATQYCPDDDGSCSKADRDIRELLDDLENLPSARHDSKELSFTHKALDTISRQEAIDLFPNDALEWDTKGGYIAPHLARRMIEELPSAQHEIVRCHKCIHWNRDTIRQNSNDAGWWNEAICERHSNEIWTSWKDADWYCADAERREE
jgi:hypothetical protein